MVGRGAAGWDRRLLATNAHQFTDLPHCFKLPRMGPKTHSIECSYIHSDGLGALTFSVVKPAETVGLER